MGQHSSILYCYLVIMLQNVLQIFLCYFRSPTPSGEKEHSFIPLTSDVDNRTSPTPEQSSGENIFNFSLPQSSLFSSFLNRSDSFLSNNPPSVIRSSPTPSPRSTSSENSKSTIPKDRKGSNKSGRRRDMQRRWKSGNTNLKKVVRPTVINLKRIGNRTTYHLSVVSQYELLSSHTFGAAGRRSNKSLSLGAVNHRPSNSRHFLVSLSNYNADTYKSTNGIRLFVEQFVQLLTNIDMFEMIFKAIHNGETIILKKPLGHKIAVSLDSRKSRQMLIALFNDEDLIRPSDVKIMLTRDEWNGLVRISHDFVQSLLLMKDELKPAPSEKDSTPSFHLC